MRQTNDIDVWIAVHPRNAENVVVALKEFGFDVPALSPALFLKDHQIGRMGISSLRLEITTAISGVSFDECYVARVQETFEGVKVNLISLHHLKINKKASGRYKDLNDLEPLP